MFSEKYWYIGILTALLVAMEVFAVLFLARHKWLSRIVLWLLALYVLITRIIDVSRSKSAFLAFSTIAYWLFGLGVFVPWRPFKSVSAAFSLIAGAVYTAGFLIYPELLSHQGTFGINYMNGYLVHDILFVGALLMYTQFEVKKYDVAIIGGLIGAVVVITELGLHVFNWSGINAFLVGIIEASVLKKEFFPNLPLTWWWYILWYILVLAIGWGIWELIRFINKRLLKYGNQMPGKLVW